MLSRRGWQRSAGVCGLLSPVLTLTMILAAVARSPWFNWQTNALSDLGVSENAVWFNSALIIGAALNGVLALGLGAWLGRGRLARLALAVLLLSAAALALIGVFTEAYGAVHWYVAAAYFLLTPVALLLAGVAMWQQGLRALGALSICAGVAAFLTITMTPADGLAVPEILTATITGCWTFTMGMTLLLGPPAPSTAIESITCTKE
jgi:hypothetical membrane protein